MTTSYDIKLNIFSHRVEKFIDGLFRDAFNSGNDCFFWQVLTNFDFRGMGNHPVLQSEDWGFFNSVSGIIDKQEDILIKIRLSLMVYCHIYENNLLPKIFRNLFMVINNEAPNMGMFPLQKNGQEQTPEYKYKFIYEYSKNDEFLNLINEIHISNIRNAFSHSDYVLMPEGMIIKPERNMVSELIDYDELSLIINKMFIFYQTFLQTFDLYRTTIYKHGDFIKGIPNFGFQNIEVINDGKSMGFKTGNALANQVSGDYLENRRKNKPILRVKIRILIDYIYNKPLYFNIFSILPKKLKNLTFNPL